MKQRLSVPETYKSVLSLKDTQIAIFKVKQKFERMICKELGLTFVQAPLIVEGSCGINDDLNGVERPVSFSLEKETVEVVQSLAKWKRCALDLFDLSGLITRMKAIRQDEPILDNIHSFFVDQWDWEKVISRKERTEEFLEFIVRKIYGVFRKLQKIMFEQYPSLKSVVMELPEEIFFISTYELEEKYPTLKPREMERKITKEKGAVFISKIGGKLKKSGDVFDGRSPDYDDWTLNGDILFWNKVLEIPFEVSSMGIRVDEKSLVKQLKERKLYDQRIQFDYHQRILKEELPFTIGGGIGVSRTLMFLLGKCHIGECHFSCWPKMMEKLCKEKGVHLLKV